MDKIILKGEISPEGQLHVELPANLTPGPVEIEIRPRSVDTSGARLGDLLATAPTGLWEDVEDSVAFAHELRRRASRRRSLDECD